MSRVRSKHGNLLNYFIYDRRDLSPAYVRDCEKFLKKLKKIKSVKRQAPSIKPGCNPDGWPSHKRSSVFPKGKINWFKKKMDKENA